LQLSVLGWLPLAQCNAPPPAPIHSGFDAAPAAMCVEPQFRAGLGHLTEAQQWPQVQDEGLDWVLLGVRVRSQGQEHVWFVRVAEIIDPQEAAGGKRLRDRRFEYTLPMGVGSIRPNAKFAIRCRRIRVETYDERGEFIDASSRLAPLVFADSSMFQALAALPQNASRDGGTANLIAGAPIGPTSETASLRDQETMRARLQDEGLFNVIAVLQALGTSPPVTPIRNLVKDHVIDMPSIFGLLLTGFRPTLNATLTHTAAMQFPWALDRVFVPAYQADFTTYLAGERFMDFRVVAGPNVPPCDLIGGLLVIEAVHPRQNDSALIVRVLASSRSEPVWRDSLAQR
jgi:hypothetical protein